MAQAAQRRIGLAKAQREALPVALEDGIDALVGDADIALDVGQRISQRRRVQRLKAKQVIVANLVRCSQIQAIGRVAQQHGRPLDQADIG